MARSGALRLVMNAAMPITKPSVARSRPNSSSTPHTMLDHGSISLGLIAISIARAQSRRFGPPGRMYNSKAHCESLESVVYKSPECSPHWYPGRACGHQGDNRAAPIATHHPGDKPGLGLNCCSTSSAYIRWCAPVPKCSPSLFTKRSTSAHLNVMACN